MSSLAHFVQNSVEFEPYFVEIAPVSVDLGSCFPELRSLLGCNRRMSGRNWSEFGRAAAKFGRPPNHWATLRHMRSAELPEGFLRSGPNLLTNGVSSPYTELDEDRHSQAFYASRP